MGLTILEGNIFTTKCQTIVNTVNCVGVMGAGIALECRLRWPEMYKTYLTLCNKGLFKIGLLWIYKAPNQWILNFPTKQHWKEPSREEFLHLGLQKFMSTYQERKINSIAFPLLGAQHGGLPEEMSQQIMESYLRNCAIPVEIYRYDPMAHDDLFVGFKGLLENMSVFEIKTIIGLRTGQAEHVLASLNDPSICQLNRLASVDGIGVKTLEKLFNFASQHIQPTDISNA